VASSGDCGSASPSFLLAPSSAKSAIFSTFSLISYRSSFADHPPTVSAFKYCCRARGEKLERTKLSYACLAKVVREGGFTIALVARLSAIPGHCKHPVFRQNETDPHNSSSYYRRFRNMRHGHHHVLYSCHSLHAQTIHHRISWRHLGSVIDHSRVLNCPRTLKDLVMLSFISFSAVCSCTCMEQRNPLRPLVASQRRPGPQSVFTH
jgi:hypothetical protein